MKANTKQLNTKFARNTEETKGEMITDFRNFAMANGR